ncbi:competence type IV pilus minor pilin ComGG [Bacillus tianshenii]|nr:competence type IV pilus minor pilin ComGG [Bacillus tianshenii]
MARRKRSNENGFIFPLTAAVVLFLSFLFLHYVEATRIEKLVLEEQVRYIQKDSIIQMTVTDTLDYLESAPEVSAPVEKVFSYPNGESTIKVEKQSDYVYHVSIRWKLPTSKEDGFILIYDADTKKIVDWKEAM